MNFRLIVKIFMAGGAVVFLLFGALLLYVIHQQKTFKNLPDSHDLKSRTVKMGNDYVAKRSEAGLVIAVIQGGKTYVTGFGKAGGTNTAAPHGETIFEIGSVTKVFTAILLADMVKAGRVGLDDPISRYVPPEVTCPQMHGHEITLKHLATHTAGLPRLPDNLPETVKDDQNPYANYHPADLYKGLAAVRLTRDPGTKSEYSNFGFGLLGHLLSRKAGKPYEALVQETICNPLGMSNTALNLTAEQAVRLIPGHSPKGKPAAHWEFDALAGCGAIRSTANDLSKFVQANLGPLNSSLGQALAEAQQVHYQALVGSVGLGWQIREPIQNQFLHWHNGGTGGFVSFIGFDRAAQVGVVVLSNYGDALAGDSSVDKMGMELLKYASRISWE